MLRMLHDFLKHFQWFSNVRGGSMQHERNMEGATLIAKRAIQAPP